MILDTPYFYILVIHLFFILFKQNGRAQSPIKHRNTQSPENKLQTKENNLKINLLSIMFSYTNKETKDSEKSKIFI